MNPQRILVVEDERLVARDIAMQLARAKLAEPVGYLEKPFGEYELREVLAGALQKR